MKIPIPRKSHASLILAILLPILIRDLSAQEDPLPRKPLPKSDPFLPEGKAFQILVKFADASKARLDAAGQLTLMLAQTPKT